jgi:hypothetical protein
MIKFFYEVPLASDVVIMGDYHAIVAARKPQFCGLYALVLPGA